MGEMTEDRRARRWCFTDLVTDARTGRLRETLMWSNVGKLVMTWAFVHVIWKGGSSEFLWLTYGSIVILHEAASRLINQRQQRIDAEAKT